jgi:hypothetical protein
MANGGLFKGPAGLGAGIAGPQGLRRIYGLPPQSLPGYTNAREAALHRDPTAGSTPALPPVDQATACAAMFLTAILCDCLEERLRNIQTTARRPSHIDRPYSGICFDRHIGTGIAASPDPPIIIPPGPAFVDIVTFIVPPGHKGVIRSFGVDVDPVPAAGGVAWRIHEANIGVFPGFDTEFGAVAPAAGGVWFGPPGTLAAPQEVCLDLFPGMAIALQAANISNVGAVSVAARMGGWIYPPTIQTDERTIRGTMTDQR